MIGNIYRCSNWYHGDTCTNLDCKRGWKERGEDAHQGCWMCAGARKVRVVEANEDGTSVVVEPYWE